MSLLIIHEITSKNDAEFVRVARALAAASATEPGTLRYQWFVTQKPGRYSIIEEYVNAAAAEEHNAHVAALLVELFAVIELVSSAFFGELNAYLRAWTDGRAGVSIHSPL
jgi:quinol monooxygenase YgiN